MTPEKFILVYNADDGLFNAVADWAHKFFSPYNYQCDLCHYTFSLRGMRYPWKEFLDSLKFPVVFLYRPQFRQLFPALRIGLPAILVEVDHQAHVLLSSDEIAEARTLDGLIETTRKKLTQLH